MEEKSFNLRRSIPGLEITWLHVFIISMAYSPAIAQTTNGSDQNQYPLYSNFDPSMAIVIVVLICAFFFVGFFSIFIRHCSETAADSVRTNAPAASAARRRGLDLAVIETFPTFVYSEVKGVKIGRGALECAVCLSEFEDDETLRLLPKCNHVFHPECIDAWLVSHVTCPVCRANLTPDPRETFKNTPQQTAAQPSEPPQEEDTREVAIAVNEEQNRNAPQANVASNASQERNRPPRLGISGKFPRSHSTGHSLVQPGENIERYTLRLPEEVRRQIMASFKLKRAMSFNVVLPTEGSSRKGYRSGGEGSSRGRQTGMSELWAFLLNPPFGSRTGSVKPSKVDGDGDSINGRTLLASVKMPLNCLGMKGEEAQEVAVRIRPLV